ncbi:acyl-CoA dehydrogenase family protein [Streptomyces sp. TRM72054]|uniref:acyl-CoA dehydrogenase family protein n=1 Tax=Streptomyces sp. TRM72054 TaxID=2870562 RepID=UPI0035AB9D30
MSNRGGLEAGCASPAAAVSSARGRPGSAVVCCSSLRPAAGPHELRHSPLVLSLTPHLASWEAAGQVDRSLFRAAGVAGLLGLGVQGEYGGSGVDDFRYNAVRNEELCRAGATSVSMKLNGRPLLQGAEPAAGSDLRGIRTRAERTAGVTCSTARRPSSATAYSPTSWSGGCPASSAAVSVTVSAVATMRRVLDEAIACTRDRIVVGRPLSELQATRFTLAEPVTETEIAQTFTDRCVAELVAGRPTATGLRPHPRRHLVRGHQRDHEGDHRQVAAPLTRTARSSTIRKPVI